MTLTKFGRLSLALAASLWTVVAVFTAVTLWVDPNAINAALGSGVIALIVSGGVVFDVLEGRRERR